MRNAFLVTTTHQVLAFDGGDRFFQVHSGKGLYYGLAQDSRCIYVSCRNQTIGPDDAVARAEETGSILVLDALALLPIAELRPEDFALRDVHGIACFDGKLWVTSSFDNLVAVFDTSVRRWTKWYPSIDVDARNRDLNHFNTIVPDRDQIYVLAHNNGPSHLLSYDRSTLELCSTMELGRQAHDIFATGGGIGTCSSAEGLLLNSTGWALRTGAFPRGVARCNNSILVGLSQVAPRSTRHEASGIVRRFTPEWHYTADYVLSGAGMILGILAIDLDESVINALEPFEARCFRGAYNPVEPGNVYSPAADGNGVFAPEWHAGEKTHRWTAARESRMTIVVNPGERTLTVCAFSAFPGPYRAEVLLNGEKLGTLFWSQPGHLEQRFDLPSGAQGRFELLFRIPHLWQPSVSLGTIDERRLGISIKELRIL